MEQNPHQKGFKLFEKWSVRQRLIVGFLLVASLITIVGFFSVRITYQVAGLRNIELPMEQSLREVEVSIWEAIQAADSYLADPKKQYSDLFKRQLNDVDEFFLKYTALVDTPEEKTYIQEFSKLWNEAKVSGAKLIEAIDKRSEAETGMWLAIDVADDIIDFDIQAKWNKKEPNHIKKEEALREVEVSIWEAIHAAQQYINQPERYKPNIGSETDFKGRMEGQFDDVAKYWPIYKSLAKTNFEKVAIEKFEKIYAKGVLHGRNITKYSDEARTYFNTMFKKVDEADDIIDHKMQVFIQGRIDKQDKIAAATRTNAILMVFFTFLVAAGLGLSISKSVTNPLARASDQIATVTDQFKFANEQALSGAAQQSATVAETTSTIQELVATAVQISKNADSVAEGAEKTLIEMKSTQDKVLKTSTRILALGEKSQTIGNILKIVDSLAEQTNLLAINAAIESARAGEAGKGFSVVASEIRKLSERSRESLEEIRGIISEIQVETNASVMGVEESSKQMEKGMALIDRTTSQVKEISMAVRQQQSSSEQVVVAIKGIDKTAKQFVEGAKSTTSATEKLDNLVKELNQLVGESWKKKAA